RIEPVRFQDAEPEALPGTLPQPADSGVLPSSLPLDLPTALRLADADSVQVNLAREQIQQAYAEYQAAGVLWLPSLRGGVHWNKHEGPLQATDGSIQEVSRASL